MRRRDFLKQVALLCASVPLVKKLTEEPKQEVIQKTHTGIEIGLFDPNNEEVTYKHYERQKVSFRFNEEMIMENSEVIMFPICDELKVLNVERLKLFKHGLEICSGNLVMPIVVSLHVAPALPKGALTITEC